MNCKIASVLIIFSFFMFSCSMQTRYMTEKFIKTNIEVHKEKGFSSIKTFSIYQSNPSYNFYLEFTGYKYKNKKGLVIGADKYYLARQKFIGDKSVFAEVTYIELSLDECKSILENYQMLLNKISAEHPRNNEEIYHDFTVNKDLFISYRKSYSDYYAMDILFWIKGEKYIVSTKTMINKLQKFMDY